MNRDSSQQHPWPTTTIAESSYLRGRIGWQGLKAAEFRHEGPYLVTGTDFRPGKIEWDTCYHVSEARFAEAEYIHLRNGDLLVTKDGTIGKIAYVEGCPEKAVLNSGIFVLRCRDGSYDHRYMFYVLQSDYFRRFLDDNLAGSTIQHLYQHVFEGFEFPLPEKTEQFKITKILSTVDRAIEQTEALISKHQRIKTGLMQDLLTRGIGEHGNLRSEQTHQFKDSPLGRIPVEWEIGIGSDYFILRAGIEIEGVSQSLEGDSLYLKVDDLNAAENLNGILVSENTFDCPGSLTTRLLQPGTIVFPKQGAAIFLNRVALLCKRATLDPNLMGLCTKPGTSPQYFRLVLLHRNLGMVCDNSGIPQINNKHLYPLMFAIPEIDEQDRVVTQIHQSEKLLKDDLQQLLKLRSLKTALMQDLLTGKRHV